MVQLLCAVDPELTATEDLLPEGEIIWDKSKIIHCLFPLHFVEQILWGWDHPGAKGSHKDLIIRSGASGEELGWRLSGGGNFGFVLGKAKLLLNSVRLWAWGRINMDFKSFRMNFCLDLPCSQEAEFKEKKRKKEKEKKQPNTEINLTFFCVFAKPASSWF